jgi:nitronate monooxygenase
MKAEGQFHSRLHTPVCDLLDCEYPILLAGMGGVSRAELVSAVTNAGAYGFLGMVREPPERIQSEIEKVRQHTDRPFGVNIIPAATDARLLQQQIDVCIENKINSISLFWDVNANVIARFRDAGIMVLHQIGSVDEAIEAWHAGAQILVAQGYEAGGHLRGIQSLLTLLPEVVNATPLPVIAAGGIVSGGGMLAAIMLGAQGVQCGTLFLATEESNAHEFHKRKIVQSSSKDTLRTEIFHVNWPAYAPVRVIQNSITRGLYTEKKTVIGYEDQRPVYLHSTDSPLKETRGELEAMALYAGQGISMINDIVPAAERIDKLMQQATSILDNLLVINDMVDREEETASSSPPCFTDEADDHYAGYYDWDELMNLLNTLLEAERAGSKMAALCIKDCHAAEQRQLLEAIYAEAIRCCDMLRKSIKKLGGRASDHIGDFYAKALPIVDWYERLAFINQWQQWLVKKLDETLPAIRNESLYQRLFSMRNNHINNISRVETFLANRPERQRLD